MVSRSRAGGGELRSVPLGLRIKPSLRAELDRLAEADRRTLASYVEIVLEAHVDAKRQEGQEAADPGALRASAAGGTKKR
jgi:hypothetical protein